ncbi:MAG: hypothetical protein JKX85_10700 [Phycisphaeraceae bacterium]|nr:hypothetical protein [Phycisphaeraceae bacterium]
MPDQNFGIKARQIVGPQYRTVTEMMRTTGMSRVSIMHTLEDKQWLFKVHQPGLVCYRLIDIDSTPTHIQKLDAKQLTPGARPGRMAKHAKARAVAIADKTNDKARDVLRHGHHP